MIKKIMLIALVSVASLSASATTITGARASLNSSEQSSVCNGDKLCSDYRESTFSSSMSCDDSRKYTFSGEWVALDKPVVNGGVMLVNPEKSKLVSLKPIGDGICLITVRERLG